MAGFHAERLHVIRGTLEVVLDAEDKEAACKLWIPALLKEINEALSNCDCEECFEARRTDTHKV